jgi:hypothetical protein
MTTLALDAATRTGLAVVRGGELLFVANVNAPGIERALEVLRPLVELGIDRIAIEAAQARGGESVREKAQSQGTLAQAEWIGLWRAVCRMTFPGVPIADVYPSTWRSGLRLPTGDRAYMKRIALAAAAQRWPGRTWKNTDEAEAALIALYMESRR